MKHKSKRMTNNHAHVHMSPLQYTRKRVSSWTGRCLQRSYNAAQTVAIWCTIAIVGYVFGVGFDINTLQHRHAKVMQVFAAAHQVAIAEEVHQ